METIEFKGCKIVITCTAGDFFDLEVYEPSDSQNCYFSEDNFESKVEAINFGKSVINEFLNNN